MRLSASRDGLPAGCDFSSEARLFGRDGSRSGEPFRPMSVEDCSTWNALPWRTKFGSAKHTSSYVALRLWSLTELSVKCSAPENLGGI